MVEDKAIAAQAVAFVVNSTRKGLVSLCADVAHLMRAKASLEKKVTNLRHENEALRAAAQHSFVDHSQFSSQLPSDDVRSDYHSQVTILLILKHCKIYNLKWLCLNNKY